MTELGELRTSAARGIATRERLLDATLHLIASEGWGGVTTRSVAEQAGVTAGVVHYHFASVDALRRAAVDRVMRKFVDVSMVHLTGHTDPASAVQDVLNLLVTVNDRDPQVSVVLFEAFLASLRDEDLRTGLAALLAATRAELTALLETRARADASAVAALLIAALDGIFLHHLIDPRINPTEIAAPLARLLADEREESS